MKAILSVALAAGPLAVLAPASAAAAECGATYTVRQGDTLTGIATRCGSTIEALVAANPGISDPASISIGQEMAIPDADAASDAEAPSDESDEQAPSDIAGEWARERDARAAPVRATGRYTVEPGDSMASIATALGVPLSEFLAANEGVDPFALRPGQELALPGGGDGSGRAAEAGGDETADSDPDRASPGAETETAAINVPDEATPEPEPDKLVLEGRVQKGAECPVLKTPDGETYSLVSQSHGFSPGDYVSIEGEAVEMSLCMQGRTVRVTSMTAKPAPEGS